MQLILRGVNNRSCIPQLNDCGNKPGTNKIKQKCKEYVSPVYTRHPFGMAKGVNKSHDGNMKLFRNRDCLECVFNTVHGFVEENYEIQCYNPYFAKKSSKFGKESMKKNKVTC